MATAHNNKPSRFLPILLAIAIFMQQLDATILNTALPSMAADLGQSPLNMQSAIIAYALTLAIMMPLSGFLSDKLGTRKLFMGSMIIFIIGSVLCAASNNLTLLVLARIIQGLGGAMLTPVARLTMMQAYERSKLITVMNYAIMPALIGPVLGPIIGGYLVEYISWHWIFLLNVPIGLLGLLVTWYIMPDFNHSSNNYFDGLGFFLFSASAFCMTLTFETMSHANNVLFGCMMAIAGIGALIAYVAHARQNNRALYPPHLILVRTFRLGLAGNLVSRLGMSALPLLLPLLFQVAFNYDAVNSGWLLMPLALAAIFAKPFLKPLMNHFGYRNILAWNTRIIGILIMSLALISANTPQWLILLHLCILGACNSLQFTGMNTITLADLRPNQVSSGTSLMAVNQQLALSFGIAIGALLLQSFSHSNFINHNITTAFRITFIILGILTMLSSWIFAHLHAMDGENLLTRKK
ncbi:DHA2 family efflux MFS transporter permease subunit [Snodgrassella communis]|uniref:DHA2 family efflux MFS transporter permease subunit n=1 Tax=Snodgrassella communis TaxID=2946699 RepID=UPI00286BA5DC|nr:DHA2 family efflux MFS transporter permease subunit [Snodgrassella communis]WMY90890.1 DHA2 family efflux MFS transporter permease subunit [Snodgrassella communis]